MQLTTEEQLILPPWRLFSEIAGAAGLHLGLSVIEDVPKGLPSFSIPDMNYDSMIAKLIVTAQTREEAIAKMRRALDEFVIEGIKTTIPFHRQLMEDPDYVAGNYTTAFMDTFVMQNE